MEACIGLGSNLGDRAGWLAWAVEAISGVWGAPLDRSSVWETAAWGMAPGTPAFLNQVVRWEVDGPGGEAGVRAAMEVLAEVERRAGRERRADGGYQDRTLDCDLLLWGAEQWTLPELVVPHPRMTQRRFVLAPLAELVPDRPVPGDGRTVATCLAQCADPQPVLPWKPTNLPA
jgi:2-amino-4-hydroxy-6-hydroxymethyldihydropteridine diphosphokinase